MIPIRGAAGIVLDRDSLVYIHRDEMILPANLSRGIQSMIAGGYRITFQMPAKITYGGKK